MKVRIYRALGYILAILFGIVGYIVNICQPHKFQRFITNPGADLLSAIYGILGTFAFNPFLWLGLLFLWRADRNESPEKKSKWGKIIKIYAIFTIIMIAITVFLILLARKQIR